MRTLKFYSKVDNLSLIYHNVAEKMADVVVAATYKRTQNKHHFCIALGLVNPMVFSRLFMLKIVLGILVSIGKDGQTGSVVLPCLLEANLNLSVMTLTELNHFA